MKNKKTSLFVLLMLVMITMVFAGCTKGGGEVETIPPEDAPVTAEENDEPRLSIETTPEVYSLAMSSTPGIRLGITMQSKGEPDVQFDTESGSFLEFENGKVTELGTKVKRKIAESAAIYWTPNKETKSGDVVSVSLVDEEGKSIAQVNLSVIEKDQTYSLKSTTTEDSKE